MTRKTMLRAFAASGLLFAGASHALPGGWYILHRDIPYSCQGNYSAKDSVTPISSYRHAGAEDIRVCQRTCDATPGCVAFSFERRTIEYASGRTETYTTCALLGDRRAHTEPMSDRGRFDWGAVCYHNTTMFNYDIDWRRELRIDQDNLRPGLPGIGAARPNPNKP